ncbi:MAG: YgjV family protein [Christensenellaceae bacterium]|jgi:hypothetical protein|nr:YgjV family protein [Christensenellaceae bacterium]
MSLIFGVLALVFSAFSLFCKNKVKMLLCQIPANIFYCLSFVFAGAFAPFVGVAVATVRTTVFFVFDLRRFRPNIWFLILFEVLTIAAVIIVFKSTLDLLPLLGLLMFTYGMWQNSEDVLRVCAIVSSVLFVIFNLIFGLYVGVLQEGIMIAAGIVSVIKYGKNSQYTTIGLDKL